jgi:hypothetical protein
MTNEIKIGDRFVCNKNIIKLYVSHPEFIDKELLIKQSDSHYVSFDILETKYNDLTLPINLFFKFDCFDLVNTKNQKIELTTVADIIHNVGKEVEIHPTNKSANYGKVVKAVIEYNEDINQICFVSNDPLLSGNNDHRSAGYIYSHTFNEFTFDQMFTFNKIMLCISNNSIITKENITTLFKKILKSNLKRDEYNESYSLKQDLELSDYEILMLNEEIKKSLNVDLTAYPGLDKISEYLKTLENNLIKSSC